MIPRPWILGGMTLLGMAVLVVVPLVRPDKANHPYDPVARMVLDLVAITPGASRDQVDKQAIRLWRRPNSDVEIFRHPRSEFLRIEVRFSGPERSDRVVDVGTPYLAPYPHPGHL